MAMFCQSCRGLMVHTTQGFRCIKCDGQPMREEGKEEEDESNRGIRNDCR